MKLKALLAVTAALSFGGAFAQANFSDVPAGHWAKDAVEKMAAKGCIIGFPDGTYRGNESLTRYQAALILARCLQEGAPVTGGLSNEDVESLKNAIQELSSELAALGVRVADVEDNAATKDDVAALEERVAALEGVEPGTKGGEFDPEAITELQDAIAALAEDQDAKIADLTSALDDLVAQLDELSSAQEDLASRVEALEGVEVDTTALEELAAAIDDLTGAVDDLTAAQDDLGANLEDLTATVDELSAGLDDLNARVDELSAANEETAAVLDEINSRIEELAGAIDDVNVRVDDLEGTVGDLSTTVDGLGEQVESNAASIVALQDLTVLLNEDIVGLEDRISALESDKADAADVDARFTNLNRDLTDLTSRVTVVETNLSDLQGKFNTLNGTFGFSVSGTLSSTYQVYRVTGQNFDIDRIIPGTKFSSGVDSDGDDKTKDRPIDYADFGEIGADVISKVDSASGFASSAVNYVIDLNNTVDGPDGDVNPANDVDIVVTSKAGAAAVLADVKVTNPNAVILYTYPFGNIAGHTDTSLSLTLDFSNKGLEGKSGYSGALASDNQAFNVHKVVAEFGIGDLKPSGIVGEDLIASDDPNYTSPLAFYVKGITTTFDIAGNPIKFTVGENLKTQFTPFVFDNNASGFGDGYLAQVDGSNLPGIGAFKPTLTVAYGTKEGVIYNRAIRATISPLTDVTLGVSAAQAGTDSMAAPASASNTVFGADLKAKVSGWNVQSEYATETDSVTPNGVDFTTNTDTIFYAHADGSVGPVSLRGDLWSLDPDFNGVSYDTGDDHKVPFTDVQAMGTKGFHVEAKATIAGFSVGGYYDNTADYVAPDTQFYNQFGVNASGNLSIVNFGAYYDSISLTGFGPLTSANRFGVTAGVTLAGFAVKGFFNSVTANGETVAALRGINSDNQAFYGNTGFNAVKDFTSDQVTKAGVNVTGNVGPVALAAGFQLDSGVHYFNTDPLYNDVDWDRTTIFADATTTLSAGIVTLKPEAHFKSIQEADAGTDDTTMFKVGLSASTATLSAFLSPSFNAAVSYYQNDHKDAATYTASELFYSLGVKSDAFLFDKSTLAVTWAGWQGKNRAYTPFSGTTAGSFNDDQTAGDITLGGIYGEWNYYDLNFAYGDFTLNDDGAVSNGQAFKISYKVKF